MSRVPGGSCVTSRPSIEIEPASGRSRPVTSRSVVVLPAPLGPSSTTNSPSLMANDKSRTASIDPKRWLTWQSATLAMACASVARRPDRRTGPRVEQRKRVGAKRQPNDLADLHRQARRQPSFDLTLLGVDSDDLRGAEIFRAEHAAAHRRSVSKADVFGTHTQHQRPRSLCFTDFGYGDAGVGKFYDAVAGRQAGFEVKKIHRRRADEVGDEHRGRPVVDFLRRADLLDQAGVHHGDPIG